MPLIRLVRENRVLDFERPPKAEPSSWTDKHHDSDFIRVVIERRTQRFTALVKVAKARSGPIVPASADEESGSGGQKVLTMHDSSLV